MINEDFQKDILSVMRKHGVISTAMVYVVSGTPTGYGHNTCQLQCQLIHSVEHELVDCEEICDVLTHNYREWLINNNCIGFIGGDK